MQRINQVSRILLGLIFGTFSLNYFVPFLPAPAHMDPGAIAFAGAFIASGLMTLMKIFELTAAIALLTNRAVPLALAVLAPIIVGIPGFHVAFARDGLPIAIGLIALELVLAWSYRSAFAPMLRLRVTPDPIRGAALRPRTLATHAA